jgi:predicted ATP-binding protein involved in virulence
MQIKWLKLENFRGFKEREFALSEHFTVLVGDNGTGKTAILDALCISAGSLFLAFDGITAPCIADEDVRRVVRWHGDVASIEPIYPVTVAAAGVVGGRQIRWKRALHRKKGKTTRKDAKEMTDISVTFQREVQGGVETTLPVIAYYGTERRWLQKQTTHTKPLHTDAKFEGYQDSLHPTSNEKMRIHWLTAKKQKKRNHQVPSWHKTVKKAVNDCLADECGDVDYDGNSGAFMIKPTDGQWLPAHLLSDGYRNLIALVADIAYRMAVLNPHLRPEATQETPGIVLIDELEHHLHPKWQRRVVEALKRTFPNVQFIATTHSPFIIQSLRPGELLNLDGGMPVEYANQSIEDIAEELMGIEMPQKSRRYVEMMEVAEKYYKLLEEGKSAETDSELKKIKYRLDKLLIPYSDDSAFQAFLKLERIAAELQEEEDETC